MYTIEITYGTGDSFGHESGRKTTVGSWKSKELAIKNANIIKEHYEIYKRIDGWENSLSEEEAIDIIMTKEWCPEFTYDKEHSYLESYVMLHSVKLELDSGDWFQYGVSTWCGYFESLEGIRVTPSDDSVEIL